jgi:hypothetical protein
MSLAFVATSQCPTNSSTPGNRLQPGAFFQGTNQTSMNRRKQNSDQSTPTRAGLFLCLFISVGIFVLSGCSARLTPQLSDFHVGFSTIGGKIPIVKARLNNKNAWFIIDTGATLTILNETQAKHYGFSVHEPRESKDIIGFSQSLKLSETSGCEIRLGDLVIRHQVYRSEQMNAMFITIANREQIQIAGIIGSDILARYKISVNYNSKTLSYRSHASQKLPNEESLTEK